MLPILFADVIEGFSHRVSEADNAASWAWRIVRLTIYQGKRRVLPLTWVAVFGTIKHEGSKEIKDEKGYVDPSFLSIACFGVCFSK